MNLSIELRSDQQRTFVGFVKNDAVALYILDKSAESFYFQNAIRCENLHLNFWAKSPFPAEPRQPLKRFPSRPYGSGERKTPYICTAHVVRPGPSLQPGGRALTPGFLYVVRDLPALMRRNSSARNPLNR